MIVVPEEASAQANSSETNGIQSSRVPLTTFASEWFQKSNNSNFLLETTYEGP